MKVSVEKLRDPYPLHSLEANILISVGEESLASNEADAKKLRDALCLMFGFPAKGKRK